jgi:Uma2 family endonuclease
MPTPVSRIRMKKLYEEAAQEYLRRLPLEHFMESTSQAIQRQITVDSLGLVQAQRPEVQVFSELLVQYPLPRRDKPAQVVPDNMVILHPEPIEAEGSYNLPDQPARPFWVLEYIAPSNPRKDYVDNMNKYEYDLKVPYYLVFRPASQEITLYRLKAKKYVSVKPNARGRYAIPQLDLEVGLHDGWMRYWFRGELLPLAVEMQQEVAAERQGRLAAEQEVVRLRAEVEQLKRGRSKRPE